MLSVRLIKAMALVGVFVVLSGCTAGDDSHSPGILDGGGPGPSLDAGMDAPPADAMSIADAGLDGVVLDGSALDARSPDASAPDASLPAPAFPHLDNVVDMMRGTVPAWVELIYVRDPERRPEFFNYSYDDTSARRDFWPASTIKMYVATAALVLLEEYGMSLDAEATFYRRADPDDEWIEDTTASFREMIYDIFDFSSNSTYTLLLRFAGIDWLNTDFFSTANGFQETALLVGYVNDRPYRYSTGEEQRIVVREGARSRERTHAWSGVRYDDRAGCTVRYGTYANCSSPRDMAEHLRRLMFHETNPPSERFTLRESDLDWMRYGDARPVMNQATNPYVNGIRRVFPEALYYHKAGRVSAYALDLHYVDDRASDVHYVAAIATESASKTTYDDLSEAIARMTRTPHAFLSLDPLRDYVNPISASLYLYAASAGALDLIIKPYAGDADDPAGWTSLAGTATRLDAGEHSLTLRSSCLDRDAQYHIRARFTPDDGRRSATSDLHYVIVDSRVACP